MFRWIVNLFRGRTAWDVYHPRERLIYKYWNGSRSVVADPLVLYKRVMACGPELSIDMKVARSPSKDATKAHCKAIVKVRDIFQIAPIEEDGLTELEAMDLLDHFLSYCDAVKKNSSLLPMQSTSTEDSKTTSPAAPPTPSSSASGSTAGDPSIAAPPPSPTELPLQSAS